LTPAAVRRGIEHAIGSAGIVHLHGVWESIVRLTAKAARKLNIPYVVAPHGMLDPWSLAQKALKKKIALALGYRTMLNRAAFLHVLNADEQSLLARLGLAARMEVIPNGIFLSEIDQVSSSALPETPAADKPFVLFLSRLHYKKGLDYLGDAFSRLHEKCPDWRLVVAGPDGGEREAFEQRVGRLHLNGSVRVVGPVYGAKKFEMLKSAACFCLPSRQEGFSIAILEAMACRVPVVVSENCHFPEVAEAGAGRVVPLDADAVAAALLDVATADADRRRQMGEAGRRLVEERFTWEKVAARSVQAYERVA
jgi:glycosyltransferase involved in cell wall biosynthesis